jgi:26S proteasome regulatory subunit N11
MEVMGLMLGEFVDDYTVRVVDVFAMPQSGTGVSVEAVDPVFQQQMLEMLKQTGACRRRWGDPDGTTAAGQWSPRARAGDSRRAPSPTCTHLHAPQASLHPPSLRSPAGRPEMVVGWYHSHPGFGCWLSGVDVNTQQSFEQLNPRAVAVVVDPIQSVKGKVVIDAFRCISPQLLMMGQEPRQTTSCLGHLNKPSIQALIHGLNRHYYSIAISYRKNELEEKVRGGAGAGAGWADGCSVHNGRRCRHFPCTRVLTHKR